MAAVNDYFRAKLTAVPEVNAYMESMMGRARARPPADARWTVGAVVS
jgi:hypothetical protein